VAAVNAGGGEAEGFKADSGFSGGAAYAVKLEADLSEAADAAPAAVYQSCRFRDCAYTFEGLAPGRAYALRLHFAETFHERAGARVFDVAANGRTLLSGYDIFAKTGARMKAVTETFDVEADAAGKLAVTFATKRDHALVNGLEVLEAGGQRSEVGGQRTEVGGQRSEVGGQRPEVGGRRSEVGAGQRSDVAAGVEAAPKPGQIRVLLLTGANNHSWQETTRALQAVFAPATNFFVRVEERPWEMKPADLGAHDVLFCNWNTFGQDKREWGAAMKSAFEAWIKGGGGFVVLHAGASMYYDWEEFQLLTGGAWEKGTFHPHVQTFTVNVADREHPITRGLADFETFDEPWQKTGNRNPARRVLLTGVVSKENKGSGEPEPFAWVTERGKGRCFNLVLGHDARALESAACRALILRGCEWAATGAVRQ
jgi:type 1 glutamine amidotransferase